MVLPHCSTTASILERELYNVVALAPRMQDPVDSWWMGRRGRMGRWPLVLQRALRSLPDLQIGRSECKTNGKIKNKTLNVKDSSSPFVHSPSIVLAFSLFHSYIHHFSFLTSPTLNTNVRARAKEHAAEQEDNCRGCLG